MQTSSIQKHLFYGTLLVLLFLGTLSAVFRTDFEGKAVTVICATALFAIAVRQYLSSHRTAL